jgi:hypothetical protein
MRFAEILTSHYKRVVRCTIVGYSSCRLLPGVAARKSVSLSADPSASTVENPARGSSFLSASTIVVDERFTILRRDFDGKWLVKERVEERLDNGVEIERWFVRGIPSSLDETLDRLAECGAGHARLLQVRARLIPESAGLHLVEASV